MKYVFSLLLLLHGSVFAQTSLETNAFFEDRKSGDYDHHLKGQVKEVRFSYTYWREGLSEGLKGHYQSFNTLAHSNFYVDYDTNGIMQHSIARMKDSINEPIDYNKVITYVHDNDDVKLKKKYAQGLQIVAYPVYNYFCAIKPNKATHYPEDIDTMQLLYEYDFFPDGKVKRETHFMSGLLPESNAITLFDSTSFVYNEKGQLTGQRVFAGPGHNEYDYKTSPFLEKDGAYGIIRYNYDSMGRIIELSFIKHKSSQLMQSYTYHPTEGYLLTRNHIDPVIGTSYSTQYNSGGDVVMAHYKLSEGSQRYEYEYDSHGNWIKCKLFLEENKTEPTAIAERLISYF